MLLNEVEQNIVICQWQAEKIIIICQSQRLRQIIDLQDTGKSRYISITKFNNCFIIRSPFFWSTKYVKSLSACSELICHFHTSVVSVMQEQNIICSKTLICRSRDELSAIEKKGKNTLNDNNVNYCGFVVSASVRDQSCWHVNRVLNSGTHSHLHVLKIVNVYKSSTVIDIRRSICTVWGPYFISVKN